MRDELLYETISETWPVSGLFLVLGQPIIALGTRIQPSIAGPRPPMGGPYTPYSLDPLHEFIARCAGRLLNLHPSAEAPTGLWLRLDESSVAGQR